MSLPTQPANAPKPGATGIPLRTPAQMEAQKAQEDRQQAAFKLRMAISDNLRRIKHIIIVMSGKGGVGKSTVATNLAASFASTGAQVGLLDLDLTNPNVPHMTGVEQARPGGHSDRIDAVTIPGHDNLKVMSTEFFLRGRESPIVWRGPIKMNMIQQMLGKVTWGDLDYLVVDLPPGTGDEPLTIAQLLKDADGVVLVTTPQAVSVLDVKKSLAFVRMMDLPVIGVIENMGTFICPHCDEATDVFGRGGGDEIAKQYGVPLLGQIPLEPGIVQAATDGKPFVWRDEDSVTKQAFSDAVAAVKKGLKAES